MSGGTNSNGVSLATCRGEATEYKFISECWFREVPCWKVSHAKYDCIMENGRRFIRVQIKTAWKRESLDRYHVRLNGHYKPDDFDVLAVYIVQMRVWYIIPIGAVVKYQGFSLYPHRKIKQKTSDHIDFEPYREAWNLITGEGEDDTYKRGSVSNGIDFPVSSDMDYDGAA